MNRFTVEIDNKANSEIFLSLLKHLNFVKSVNFDKTEDEQIKKLTDEDWVRPGRPATDEEHEEMLLEAEKSPLITTNELRENVLKRIKKCKK